MNYYNPYLFSAPMTTAAMNAPRVGLLARLFGRSGVTLGGIINGTQRVLTFANQAIPFVKQVRPIIGNAKTMFKVMNEFKKSERPRNNTNTNYVNKNINNNIKHSNEINNVENNNQDGPTFFM